MYSQTKNATVSHTHTAPSSWSHTDAFAHAVYVSLFVCLFCLFVYLFVYVLVCLLVCLFSCLLYVFVAGLLCFLSFCAFPGLGHAGLICLCTFICICICICICVCICACICTCIRMYMYKYMYMCMHIAKHLPMCTWCMLLSSCFGLFCHALCLTHALPM